MQSQPILMTERTRLRPMNAQDFFHMRELDNSAEVVRYLGHGRIRSEDETRANLSKILSDYERYGLGLYLVENLSTGEFLGRAGLIPWQIENQLTWEVGYTFKPSAWGHGYATEVAKSLVDFGFDKMKQTALISIIHPENTASIHVATKVGMKFWKTHELKGIDLSLYRREV